MTSVEKIHNEGKSFYSFPFRVYYMDCTVTEGEERLIISVPKRIFKRAVKRNLIRRRIRHAWRLNRSSFSETASKHFLVIYTTSEILDYERISESVKTVFSKIS